MLAPPNGKHDDAKALMTMTFWMCALVGDE